MSETNDAKRVSSHSAMLRTKPNAEATPEEHELRDDELKHVSGGTDGTRGGNVTGGWDLTRNKVHA